MTRYQHIIWDWNGTLLDDAWLCIEIVNRMLCGRSEPPITSQQYQTAFDFPVQGYYRRIGFDFSEESFESIASEFIASYDQQCLDCQLQNHAVSVLEACAAHGLTQSILSASRQQRLTGLTEHFQIRHFFTTLVGLDHHYATSKLERGKHLLDQLNLCGQEVMLVGDTVHDFEVSQALGIDCVLIPSGHQPSEKLVSCEVPVLDALTDVPLTLVSMPHG